MRIINGDRSSRRDRSTRRSRARLEAIIQERWRSIRSSRYQTARRAARRVSRAPRSCCRSRRGNRTRGGSRRRRRAVTAAAAASIAAVVAGAGRRRLRSPPPGWREPDVDADRPRQHPDRQLREHHVRSGVRRNAVHGAEGPARAVAVPRHHPGSNGSARRCESMDRPADERLDPRGGARGLPAARRQGDARRQRSRRSAATTW